MRCQISLTIIPYWAWRTLDKAGCAQQKLLDAPTLEHYFGVEDLAYLYYSTTLCRSLVDNYIHHSGDNIINDAIPTSCESQETTIAIKDILTIVADQNFQGATELTERASHYANYTLFNESAASNWVAYANQLLIGTIADSQNLTFNLKPRWITTTAIQSRAEGSPHTQHVIGLFAQPVSTGSSSAAHPMNETDYDALFERLLAAGVSIEQLAAMGLFRPYVQALRRT